MPGTRSCEQRQSVWKRNTNPILRFNRKAWEEKESLQSFMPDMMVLKLLQCNYSRQLSDSYIHKTAVLFWKQAWEHMFSQEKYIQWQAEFIFTCKLGNLLVLKLWKTTLHIELRQHIKKPNECLSKHFTPFVLLLSWIWLYHKYLFSEIRAIRQNLCLRWFAWRGLSLCCHGRTALSCGDLSAHTLRKEQAKCCSPHTPTWFLFIVSEHWQITT